MTEERGTAQSQRRQRIRAALPRYRHIAVAVLPFAVFVGSAIVGGVWGPRWVLCLLGMSVVLLLVALLWQVLGDKPWVVATAAAVGAVLVVALFISPGWTSDALHLPSGPPSATATPPA